MTKSRCVCPQASASVRGCRACQGVENRREMHNCRVFWTRVGSLRLKSANGHRDGDWGGRGRKTQNCRHFWTLRVSTVSTVTGIRGLWSQNAELSSLLDLRCVFASSRLKSVNTHRDRGVCGREKQNCRHVWTCVGSWRFKSANSYRDRGGGSCSRNADLSSL